MTTSIKSIYELWLGNTASQDGALQLLQIRDYIWTWARDVYRPQIQSCLRSNVRTLDRAESVISQTSTAIMLDRRQQQLSFHPPSSEQRDADGGTGARRSEETPSGTFEGGDGGASAHTFLDWASRRRLGEVLAESFVIRHANIVEYSAHALHTNIIFEDVFESARGRTLPAGCESVATVIQHLGDSKYSFFVRVNDFQTSIMQVWTRQPLPRRDLDNEYAVKVFMYCQTFCDPDDWQIKSQLYYLACSKYYRIDSETVVHTESGRRRIYGQRELAQVFDSMQQRNLSAHLEAAMMRDTQMVMPDPTEGVQDPARLITGSFDRNWNDIVSYVMALDADNGGSSDIRLSSSSALRESTDLSVVSEVQANPMAVLAVETGADAQKCRRPRFCMFVLANSYPDKATLGQLLRKIRKEGKDFISNGNMSNGIIKLSADDDKIIREAKKLLR